ncbi:STAS domain-containing protein [candidate division KSB1 bacterium]|nr:STAS domain-containing protein [candidate division KSB1 bacterium]RQW06580.1 MAG: anti-sigma factor antagonist [candidate division KSB1 bacterium]
MDAFSIDRVNKNDCSILYLNGFLDAHTAPDLENELEKLIAEERFRIVVNFKNLTYISSAGLGVFMGYIETIRDHGGDIKMCSMSPKIFRVFDLLGFPTLYDIVQEEDRAIELFFKPEQK